MGLGRTAVVSAIRVPHPPIGLWLKGHKVGPAQYFDFSSEKIEHRV